MTDADMQTPLDVDLARAREIGWSYASMRCRRCRTTGRGGWAATLYDTNARVLIVYCNACGQELAKHSLAPGSEGSHG